MKTNQFGLKSPIADLNNSKGNYVLLYLPNTTLCGRLLDLDGTHLLLDKKITRKIGPKGNLLCVDNQVDVINSNIIAGFKTITQEEFQQFKNYADPFMQYLDHPVRIKNGGEEHYGILHALYDNELLLRPSLVPYLKNDKSKHSTTMALRWERDLPTLVRRPADIIPIRKKDLELMVTNSHRFIAESEE